MYLKLGDFIYLLIDDEQDILSSDTEVDSEVTLAGIEEAAEYVPVHNAAVLS